MIVNCQSYFLIVSYFAKTSAAVLAIAGISLTSVVASFFQGEMKVCAIVFTVLYLKTTLPGHEQENK